MSSRAYRDADARISGRHRQKLLVRDGDGEAVGVEGLSIVARPDAEMKSARAYRPRALHVVEQAAEWGKRGP
jgi:hypothetical protein